MNFDQAIKDIQDTLVVVAEIQRRQSEVQKVQAEEIDAMRTLIREGLEGHEKRMQHVEQNLSEISDKLNGLIGYMEGFPKQPPQ